MARCGFVWLALWSAGCAGTPRVVERSPSAQDYAPVQVGDAKTYAVRFQGQTGQRTIRVTGQDGPYFVDDAGGALRHTPEGLRDRQRFLIRHPLEAGRTWKAILSASAVERYRILSVGDACEAHAGRFEDCLVVEASLRRDEKLTLFSRFTWARGVGLVKILTEVEIAGRGRVPQTEQSLLHAGHRDVRSAGVGGPGDRVDGPPDEGSGHVDVRVVAKPVASPVAPQK